MKRAIALLLPVLLILGGCGKQQSSDFFAMDTVMTFTVNGSADGVAHAKAEVTRLEKLFSLTDENSEITRLNTLHSGEFSDDTVSIVKRAQKISKRTDGAFDPTVRAVSKLWGFTSGSPSVPDGAAIEKALGSVDCSQIFTDGNRIDCDGEIDLGGIAKGYAAEMIRKRLTEDGVKSAALSLGGNVAVIGSKPDGSAWKVGIRDPLGDGVFGTVKARDTAVVTSGGYERNFVENGVTYHHIIDPKTGYPADSGIISATVVSKDDTLADALSTAVYVMGKDGAEKLWRGSDDFEMILVSDDGVVYLTEGLRDSFTLLKESYGLSVIQR